MLSAILWLVTLGLFLVTALILGRKLKQEIDEFHEPVSSNGIRRAAARFGVGEEPRLIDHLNIQYYVRQGGWISAGLLLLMLSLVLAFASPLLHLGAVVCLVMHIRAWM